MYTARSLAQSVILNCVFWCTAQLLPGGCCFMEGVEVNLTQCWELPRLPSTACCSWKCWTQEAGTCAWEEKGRGFVDTAAGGGTVGLLPQGFLTCRAPKQKAAGLRQTRCPQSIPWPKATSSCLPGPAAGSQWWHEQSCLRAGGGTSHREIWRPQEAGFGRMNPSCHFLVSAEELLPWARRP